MAPSMKNLRVHVAFFLCLSLIILAMASNPAANPSSQTPSQLSDDEDPNPDTQDPYAGLPQLPEGLVWNQFPLDERFLSDPEWYDALGINMIKRRRIFASHSKSEQVAAALTLLADFPTRGLQVMFAAAVKGKTHVIEALLDAGVRPHPAPVALGEPDDEQSAVPLHAAAFNGHLVCVRVLVEKGGVGVNARCDIGGTPLMRACWGKHAEIVSWLLANGADPVVRQESGTTAFEFAAGGGKVECAQLLLEHLRQGEQTEQEAATMAITLDALKAGANSGNVEMLQFLLEKSGYPTDKDDGVWKGERLNAEQRRNIQDTLRYADDVPALRLLLGYLARLDDTKDFGVIDLPQEVKEGIMDILFASLNKPEFFKLMWSISFSSPELTTLEYEGQTSPKTDYINKLLHEGAKEGSLDCVKFILAMPNVDINAPGPKKVGHLYRAAIEQQLEIVRYILENEDHQPDLHQANGLYANGATALFGAVMGGNADIVKLILKHGGPLETPLDMALLSKEPKKVIVRAAQTYRSPVTIELWRSEPSKETGSRSVELELDGNDVDWLASIQLRKSDAELKENDRGGRELKKQDQSSKT